MRMGAGMLTAVLLAVSLVCGCGSGGSSGSSPNPTPTPTPTVAAAPTIATSTSNGAQNVAVIVSLSTTTTGATVYFTLDGSTPTTSSQPYTAPFLVASNLTVNAITVASGDTNSPVTTKAFAPNIPSGTLVWSDEFANTGTTPAQPNPAT